MKKNLVLFLTILTCLSFSCLKSYAQETQDSALWRIVTIDDNEFLGSLIRQNNKEVHLSTEKFGILTIQRRDIKSMRKITEAKLVQGELWLENPQSTRYFIGPNAYSLRKNEGLYQNAWIFFNQFNYGITDNISMGFGFVPLFLFGGAPTPIWVTPKFSVPIVKDKFNVGGSALIGGILGGEDVSTGGAFGYLLGTATIGSRDNNLSVGLGYGFAGGEFADIPAISISGMARTGKRAYIMGESYVVSGGGEVGAIVLLGGRYVGKRVSVDYGGFIPVASGSSFFVWPWVGIGVPLGKK